MGFATQIAVRNLKSDRFATLCAILGVALGTATVDVVLILDQNTQAVEANDARTDPSLEPDFARTIGLRAVTRSGDTTLGADPKKETHEDYEVMRSAIRLGSLSAFLVGALIVFFTFGVVIERRRREIALMRSLGATRGQMAAVLLVEAAIIGVVGAAVGIALSIPAAWLAAALGISTTGRARIWWIWLPKREMLLVAVFGALTALLGVLRPVREVLKLDISETLRPQFLSANERAQLAKRSRSLVLITLPFMALLYVLIRPFFEQLLPSLAFFVLEAGIVCAAFLSMLVVVPELVRLLGRVVALVLPRGSAAPRLLTLRRIERMGHEIAWSISGVMFVFALLLALHITTLALKREVNDWAASSIRKNAFIYAHPWGRPPRDLAARLPPEVHVARFSSRTPWPNSVYAVSRADLRQLAADDGRAASIALAERFGPGTTILSTMMARRLRVGPGDTLFVRGRDGERPLTILAVTDTLGYVPMIGPYRNSKTYALIEAHDFPLIERYAEPIGSALVLSHPGDYDWDSVLAPLGHTQGVRIESGRAFERDRVRETNKDFALFDLILFLTTVLAAVGVANNLVLSTHLRRRELALYRVLGMTTGQIRQLFLLEGGLIGALGGLLAVLLGIPLGYAAIGALRVVSAFEVSFELPLAYPIQTLLGAVLTCLTASLYPAARAANARAAEAVHYE